MTQQRCGLLALPVGSASPPVMSAATRNAVIQQRLSDAQAAGLPPLLRSPGAAGWR
jgi:hypothetical protein